jgi:quercetin dioxygenase-like cupin family protein
MNNKEYADAVNRSEFPDSIEVPIDPPFVDDRGVITNAWLGNSGSVTLITSVKGAIRARHTHTTDWHSTLIIEGQIRYIEEENGNHREWIFNKGDQFFTKPGVYHEMHFLTDSVMITINNMHKDHQTYESDVKRKQDNKATFKPLL